jgi:hypothetical protein
MPYNRDKQCLDDSMMVDTSSAVSRGQRASAASHGTMNDGRKHLQAFIFSCSPFSCSRALWRCWRKVHNTL